MIFLDHAATSLLKPSSVEYAVAHALRTMASPGRGGYGPAMSAANTVFRCREQAAELFHVPEPEQVVFTMNATHALNLAIRSLACRGKKVVVSGFEHNAVTRPLHALQVRTLVAGKRLFDRDDTLREFSRLLPGSSFAICTAVSNVFGYILPIREIAELCRKEGIPLIIDASQAAGVLNLDFQELGAAFMAMPGHKGLLGPQGTGILLCGEDCMPLLFGGSGSDSRSQEMPPFLPDRVEAGTQNVCGIAGLLAGLEYVKMRTPESLHRYECSLMKTACSLLQAGRCELFMGEEGTQTGVLSLRVPGMDCEFLAQSLAEQGICVRGGLHCAPLAHESAGTLETGTLRLSFSPFLSENQVKAACGAILQFL